MYAQANIVLTGYGFNQSETALIPASVACAMQWRPDRVDRVDKV